MQGLAARTMELQIASWKLEIEKIGNIISMRSAGQRSIGGKKANNEGSVEKAVWDRGGRGY